MSGLPVKERFEVVLFDLGDTLIHFIGDWNSTFDQAKRKLVRSLEMDGLQLGSDFLSAFSSRMGSYFREREVDLVEQTARTVLENLLADCGFANISEAIILRSLTEMYTITQAQWIPELDALPTLNRLRALGYRMGLVSNAADDQNTQKLVDKLGAREHFDIILSSAATGIRKPDPKIFAMALSAMKVSSDRVAMVGDTLGADILGAKNAGIFSVWITRRADTLTNRTNALTIKPDAIIRELSELPDLLLANGQAAC